MNRRYFFKACGMAGVSTVLIPETVAGAVQDEHNDRAYCVKLMDAIAEPVLVTLSKGELRKKMPVEAKKGHEESRRRVTHLEAFGRLMAGIAPWLELGPGADQEGKRRAKYIDLALKSIDMAVDPQSPDFMNFNGDAQALVDTAFLAHGLIRAREHVLSKVQGKTRTQLLEAMRSSRVIKPGFNNWLLFSAMVEALLLLLDEKPDLMRIDYAVKEHMEWYKGDGWYGDGPGFHWDYYNSFVIQPMLLDIVRLLVDHGLEKEDFYAQLLRRAQRYAVIQERLISPEATYPAIGRSLAYRFGAFQLLSQLSLHHQLPESLPPAQVRSALTAVIRKQMGAEGTFDQDGWLRIGFCGHQPEIGEAYISTGSLYLCATGLLHLGLPKSDAFWQGPSVPWTSKKAWSGHAFPIDHAL